MARNQTVSLSVQNMFALNRVRKECYYEPIRVDFSPIQKYFMVYLRPNNQSESVIPFFNRDGNYFTPAFVLKREKVHELLIKISMEENLKSERMKFEARISHSQKLTQDETPEYKPTDNKYCQLCKIDFGDYWEHVNDKYHKRMINSSKFNKDIIGLCESFEGGKGQTPAKTKRIEKQKSERKTGKGKEPKAGDKKASTCTKQCSKQQLKGQNGKPRSKQNDSPLIEHKIAEQSLKITLQMGNYSTNMISNNTFKQFCQEV